MKGQVCLALLAQAACAISRSLTHTHTHAHIDMCTHIHCFLGHFGPGSLRPFFVHVMHVTRGSHDYVDSPLKEDRIQGALSWESLIAKSSHLHLVLLCISPTP